MAWSTVPRMPTLLLLLCAGLAGCKLEVQVLGDGAGNVASSPAGIDCGNTRVLCSTTPRSSAITLTATPAPGSTFEKWSGACSGTEPTCTVTPTKGTVQVTAHFDANEPLVLNCGTPGAKAGCLSPKFPPEYYAEQSKKYFLTMESKTSVMVQPKYSSNVIRWEWPPWLMLTGYTKFNLIWTDTLLKLHPTAYDVIDCRGFDTQPFGRCRVIFDYSGEKCPIYEEFTFNDKGEMTFIEAWSDYPTLVPMKDPNDTWGDGPDVARLATRVPGLGNTKGLIDPKSAAMLAQAANDADVADMVRRVNMPYTAYIKELAANSKRVANGCRPPQ